MEDHTRTIETTLSAAQLGRYAERNLSSLIQAALRELRRREDIALLSVGVGLCRARQDVRAAIHSIGGRAA